MKAYEKEDEAPAAAPAEKKEKAAEKVNEECATELNIYPKSNCSVCIPLSEPINHYSFFRLRPRLPPLRLRRRRLARPRSNTSEIIVLLTSQLIKPSACIYKCATIEKAHRDASL